MRKKINTLEMMKALSEGKILYNGVGQYFYKMDDYGKMFSCYGEENLDNFKEVSMDRITLGNMDEIYTPPSETTIEKWTRITNAIEVDPIGMGGTAKVFSFATRAKLEIIPRLIRAVETLKHHRNNALETFAGDAEYAAHEIGLSNAYIEKLLKGKV